MALAVLKRHHPVPYMRHEHGFTVPVLDSRYREHTALVFIKRNDLRHASVVTEWTCLQEVARRITKTQVEVENGEGEEGLAHEVRSGSLY